MKNIVVPTDFSPSAAFATNAAIEICRKIKGKLLFLHGFETWVDWPKLTAGKEKTYPEIYAQIQSAEKKLDALLVLAKDKGVAAEKSMVFYQDGRVLLRQLETMNHDLMVLGSHGIDGFKKYTLGSTTSKILRASKKPVLVIQKELPSPMVFKHIVFASGLEPDTHGAFEMLLQFAIAMEAENVHFIEVTTPNNFQPSSRIRESMKTYVAQHHFPKLQMHNINHFNIESGILEFVQEINADLVGIANHGRTDISSLFIESIPENLVRFSDLPVLSIRV